MCQIAGTYACKYFIFELHSEQKIRDTSAIYSISFILKCDKTTKMAVI